MTGQSNKSESPPAPRVNPDAPRVRRKDRVFRRSRAARARRAQQDKKDFRLVVIMLQLSVLGALVLAALGIAGVRVLSGDGASDQNWLYAVSAPVFMGLSLAEIGAGLFFFIVIGALLWRVRRPR
ncbi:hypothetical protein [Robiginitomaculum antarcticum]|uniref:hypothetical protein n=1 Tax=Robiginitomaculum antarcticum TaxID=437507 RepID=UPI00037BB7B0|nr:hypothetical protein [Robiginitomaculum antarcticum]